VNSLSPQNPIGENIANINSAAFGPVIWPSFGYYSSDLTVQYSPGLHGQIGTILFNGYLYVYGLDNSGANGNKSYFVGFWNGQFVSLPSTGAKVWRAQIQPNGMPGPFMAYNIFTSAFDQPALPTSGADGTLGFNKYNLMNYISQPGPQVPALFSVDPGAIGVTGYPLQTNKFAVGYDAANNIFVGIEQYASGSGTAYAARLSYDLVHWSPRTSLTYNGVTIGTTTFAYVTLTSADFTSQDRVNLNNLYVMGTNGGVSYYFQMSLQTPIQ
jgi:hypothetical protein